MSLPASIPAAILDTVLGRLACLFLLGANGDTNAARAAALHMLIGYNVQTEQELCLAAEIISFSLHSLEALGQSVDPDIPLNKTIRLRSIAVSLSREAHRGRKALEQLQRARLQDAPQPQTFQPETAEQRPTNAPQLPTMEKAVEMVEFAREAIHQADKQRKHGKYDGQTWTQNYQKRLAAQRLAEKANRKAAEDREHMESAAKSAQAIADQAQAA